MKWKMMHVVCASLSPLEHEKSGNRGARAWTIGAIAIRRLHSALLILHYQSNACPLQAVRIPPKANEAS